MSDLFGFGDPRIAALAEARDQLSARDQGFANSLIGQFERDRRLSEKQWYWVGEMARRATAPKEPVPEKPNVGSLQGVVQLLERARQHLKHPAVLVRVQGRDMRLNIAGEQSRAPDSINVTTPGSFHDRTWFGRIDREGNFEASRRESHETTTAIVAALRALAEDPAKAASEYGRMTGICAFCGTPLTDERSTAVGYGKICSQHYHLPYPKMSEVATLQQQFAAAA